MTKFLEKTAQHIYRNHAEDLHHICVILPNRRGGLFLKKYLSAEAKKTIWSPDIYSVEDFFSAISGLRLINSTEQLFELYEVHRELEKENASGFDEFLSWGPQMLHDFEETDNYLADPHQLFTYLSESKAISLWNLEGQPLTDFEKKYLQFYNSLYSYYQGFHNRLKSNGMAYAGMMFREVAGRIHEIRIPWKKIIIAGMNAMTAAEEKVYDFLYKEEKAEFLWDADRYYTDGKFQEAGTFMREWKSKWASKEFLWSEDNFSSEKNISVTAVPDDLGQVKYCGQVLSELLKAKVPPEEIAVVLPDEQLLIPLLNSLPEEVEDVNVTMGLPLRFTPLYSLFDLLLRMHLNVQKFRKSDDKNYRFYYRDIIAVLKHPDIAALEEAHTFIVEDLLKRISSGDRIFYKKDDLYAQGSDLFNTPPLFLDVIFSTWLSLEDALSCLKRLTGLLQAGLKRSALDLEYLFAFSKIIHQLEVLIGNYHAFQDVSTFYKLFLQLADSTKLPFYGEPLKGIQVMGMLETRTLDFSHVIVLSVNEGILPSGKSNHSFIPFDIKRTFGLPTYLHNNAIYAYHFYRMIQYSGDIRLFFNSTGDGLGGGEKSRFISQLLHELPAFNPSVRISTNVLSTAPPAWNASESIVVPKEGAVLVKLLDRGQRGLSPTTINTYRQCPVKFYFREIANLREPEETAETVDAGTLGSAIHEVLRLVFDPLKDKFLTEDDIQKQFTDLDTLINAAFKTVVPGCDMRSGKNLLVWNIAKMLVQNYLKAEMVRVGNGDEISVKFLEEWFERPMKVSFGKEFLEIRLKGKIDRIDSCRNGWMVLDYKTGKFDKKELAVVEWEELKTNPAMDKVFQLLLYSWMFQIRVWDTGSRLFSGIIGLKNPQNGIPLVTLPENGASDYNLMEGMNEFGKILNELLTEMFDVTLPFRQTDDTDVCMRCEYANLCCR